jgi:cellulose synthase operon protein YhjQ
MPLICCTSPKGGVGKTTLAANLADALRRSGRPVLALDLDPQNALRLHLGLPMQDAAGFCLNLPHRPDWRMAVRETPSGVRLLPHGSGELREALALAAALEESPDLVAAPLREILADPALIVVADTPPGASQALAAVLPQAALILVVLQADAGSTALLPDLDSGRFLGRSTLASLFAARMRVVLNQVDSASRLSASISDAMARHLGPRLLGAICRHEAVGEALASQRLLAEYAPRSRAAEDVADLARAVILALPQPTPASPPSPPPTVVESAFATPPFAAPWGLR